MQLTSSKKVQVPAGVEEDFEPYNWLSDASIAYASTCLAMTGGSTSLLARQNAFPKGILIMDPALAFWFGKQEDPQYLQEARAEMKVQDLDLVLCPINDAHSTSSADAGCHWSLLVCWRNGCSSAHRSKGSCHSTKPTGDPHGVLCNFRYYDSLGGLFAEKGFAEAEELANRIAGRPVQVETGKCSQQTNFYDCGVYVLLFSEIIAKAFVDARGRGGISGHTMSPRIWENLLVTVTPEEVDACRSHYHGLAREGTQH